MRRFPLKIVDDTLKRLFYRLGVAVGSQPGYFIIVPLLLTARCATGFQRMHYNYDPGRPSEKCFLRTAGENNNFPHSVKKFYENTGTWINFKKTPHNLILAL